MPVIRVELSAGRSQEQKQKVVTDVTRSLVAHCGCTPESVHVVFVDVQASDWAVGGAFLGPPKS
ncbi:tautomerase family protein [Acidovorax sp. Be4]|uniref:Tautomerase family protein n=1 Tax=Acidovorax bellezanensis TaxID=2976702 RepID=A0ABT2PPV6_9BURK|nr:tautomerase family protein [Acidovorax sp. Be4]MCT9811237.1 tautomerase family protein [Acidovorax sp. Be4]